MTNKKNTIIFIIAGTIVNVIILLALLLIFVIFAAKVFGNTNPQAAGGVLIVGIIVSWLLGMFLYQKLATWVIKKWNLEDKLDPLFASRTMKKNRFDNGF